MAAMVANSAQIEARCKQRPLGLGQQTCKGVKNELFEQVRKVKPASASSALNVADLPEVFLTDFDPKKFKKKVRARHGERGTNHAIGLAAVDEEKAFESSDSEAKDAAIASAAPTGPWACSQCTFVNNALLVYCEMCDAPATVRTFQAALEGVAQPMPEDRDSAMAWPSLAQAGHSAGEQWDKVSTMSWLEVADPSTLEDDASSVMSFMEVGGFAMKRDDSYDDDAKSVSSCASFLVVGNAGEAPALNYEARSVASTSWAAKAAAAASKPAPRTVKAVAPRQRAVTSKLPEPVPREVDHDSYDDDMNLPEYHDMTWSRNGTWSRHGQFHRGRQWQK